MKCQGTGTTATKTHNSRGFVFSMDFIWDVISVVFSLVDVICDMIVAYNFYKAGSMTFFYLSVAIFVGAQLAYTFLFMATHDGQVNFRNTCTPRVIFGMFARFVSIFCVAQLVPILNWIEVVFRPKCLLRFYEYVGLKSTIKDVEKPIIYDDDDLETQMQKLRTLVRITILKHLGFLLEAFVEAIPQAILQTVAIVMSVESSWVSVFSIAMSVSVVASKGYLMSASPHRPTFFFNCICVITDCVGLFASYTLLYSGNREIDESSMYMPIFKALITNIYAGIAAAGAGMMTVALVEYHWPDSWRRIFCQFLKNFFTLSFMATIVCLSILPVSVAIGIFKLSIVPILVFNATDMIDINIFKSGGRSKEALFFYKLRQYILTPWRGPNHDKHVIERCQLSGRRHRLADLKLQMVNRYLALLDLRRGKGWKRFEYHDANCRNAMYILKLTRPSGPMVEKKNPFSASEIRNRVRWAWVRAMQPVAKKYFPRVHAALRSVNIFHEADSELDDWSAGEVVSDDVMNALLGLNADQADSDKPDSDTARSQGVSRPATMSCTKWIQVNTKRAIASFVAAHTEIADNIEDIFDNVDHHRYNNVFTRMTTLAQIITAIVFFVPLFRRILIDGTRGIWGGLHRRRQWSAVTLLALYAAVGLFWGLAAVCFIRFVFLLPSFAMYSLVQPLLYLPTALRTLWIWKANTDIDYLPPGSLPVPCEAYPVHPVAAVLIAMYALCFAGLLALVPMLWRFHLLGFDIVYRSLKRVTSFNIRKKLFNKQRLQDIAKFCDGEILRRRRNHALCHVTQAYGNLSSINRVICAFAHDDTADWKGDPSH